MAFGCGATLNMCKEWLPGRPIIVCQAIQMQIYLTPTKKLSNKIKALFEIIISVVRKVHTYTNGHYYRGS